MSNERILEDKEHQDGEILSSVLFVSKHEPLLGEEELRAKLAPHESAKEC